MTTGHKDMHAAPLGIALVIWVVLSVMGALEAMTGGPSVSTLLDVSYGKGPAQVGALRARELDPSSPPLCPAMFQMTHDGSLWVLDSVNARILEFRDGKQVACTAAGGPRKIPNLFGVTRRAVFVGGTERRDDMPAGLLWRYDRVRQTSEAVDLDLPEGRRFTPIGIVPLGSTESQLLIYGSSHPDNESAAVAIDEKGSIKSVCQSAGAVLQYMAAADGSIWRVSPGGEQQADHVPILIQRRQAADKVWESISSASIPRRPLLSAQRKQARLRPLGVDSEGRVAVALFEGRPASVRFVRLSISGEILSAVTLEELGMAPAPLYSFFAAEHYQLLPDGSVLAQYATPERYRIIRVVF